MKTVPSVKLRSLAFALTLLAGVQARATNCLVERCTIRDCGQAANPRGSQGGISQLRGQIYNNTVFVGKGFAGKGEVVKPFAFRGGEGFAVRNNIFVAGHDGEFFAPGGGSFQNNCYWRTNADLHLAGCASLAAWRTKSGQEMLNGAAVGFQVDPRLRAPGRGGSIDYPVKLASLSANDLLPSSPLLGKGLDLEKLFKIAPGPWDFGGAPLRPGTQHSPGAIDEPTTATAHDALPAPRYPHPVRSSLCRRRIILVHPTQECAGLRPGIFQGISPVSNGTCLRYASADILEPPGEMESGSAGTQPDKGYPGSGAPMARQASDGFCHQGPFS
jgi:hypothetical protein